MATTNPTQTSADKPFGITQIKAYIPIVLDLEKMNYDVWRELFETHCLTFGVLENLDSPTTVASTTEKTWKERDDLVKMWIYGTITTSLTETILKPKSTAYDLWLALENLFRDNKETRALQLENELRTITIGDLSVQEYCRKLKSLSDLLANVDSPVSDRALVMHCLNGLNEKFDGIHNVIRHRTPFPSFSTTRSMLQSEEDRLKKSTRPAPSNPATASSPNVLYAADQSSSPQNYNNRGNTNKTRGRGGGRSNRGRGRYNNSGQPSYPNPRQFGYQQWSYGPPQWSYPFFPAPGPYPAQFAQPSQQNSILGPYPTRPQSEAHLLQNNNQNAATSALVPTALTQAFNTMTLQEPTDPSWYMDTGATDHITAQQGSRNQENPSPLR